MCPLPNYVSSVAFLIADPARAAMLIALVDGRALPAGELAYAAGVTAQTASAHLAKLLDGGLLTVEKEGRHRYYRLAGPQVAHALEHLAAVREPVRRKPLCRQGQDLRFARRCYDHLAGKLGVAVASGLQARGFMVAKEGKRFSVTHSGSKWFASMGLDVDALNPGRHGIARQCLDWTERRHHLGGPLGVQFMAMLCSRNWLLRSDSSREIRVTAQGKDELERHLGIDLEAVAAMPDPGLKPSDCA